MPDGSPLCVEMLAGQERRLTALEGRVVDVIAKIEPTMARMDETMKQVGVQLGAAFSDLRAVTTRLEVLAEADRKYDRRLVEIEKVEAGRKADTERNLKASGVRKSMYLKWGLGILGGAATAVIGWLLARAGIK